MFYLISTSQLLQLCDNLRCVNTVHYAQREITRRDRCCSNAIFDMTHLNLVLLLTFASISVLRRQLKLVFGYLNANDNTYERVKIRLFILVLSYIPY